MPQYRRAFRPGGTFFFTLVTEGRAALFDSAAAREILHRAIVECRAKRPFEINAMVLLPDHLHVLLTLPPDDADYPTRIAAIKARFTRQWLDQGGCEQARSYSRVRARRRGVWQRHFWEHLVRDRDDYNQHFDYIVYNPVKHGLVQCPHLWLHSSFSRAVAKRLYLADWQCSCAGQSPVRPSFDNLPVEEME